MRGDPDHVSNDARDLLSKPAVLELRERMRSVCAARIRAASTNAAEECRGAVAQFQACESMWSMLESMVNEQEQRDRRVVREVV